MTRNTKENKKPPFGSLPIPGFGRYFYLDGKIYNKKGEIKPAYLQLVDDRGFTKTIDVSLVVDMMEEAIRITCAQSLVQETPIIIPRQEVPTVKSAFSPEAFAALERLKAKILKI